MKESCLGVSDYASSNPPCSLPNCYKLPPSGIISPKDYLSGEIIYELNNNKLNACENNHYLGCMKSSLDPNVEITFNKMVAIKNIKTNDEFTYDELVRENYLTIFFSFEHQMWFCLTHHLKLCIKEKITNQPKNNKINNKKKFIYY
jgi:hypothetical protein